MSANPEMMPDNPLTYFPASEIWRLFMERTRHNEGPDKFDEKEKGYMEGLTEVLNIMLSQPPGTRLTVGQIVKYHDIVAETINKYPENNLGKPNEHFELGIRSGTTGFGFILDREDPHCNATVEGILELVESIQEEIRNGATPSLSIEINIPGSDKLEELVITAEPINMEELTERLRKSTVGALTVTAQDKESIANRFNKIIETFYQELDLAGSEDDKLRAIAKFIHSLEFTHGFEDANCRTVVMELSIWALRECGLSLAMLKNPNRFDLFSVSQLVDELKEGRLEFESYSTKNLENYLQENNRLDVTEIKKHLSDDSEKAMAQINSVFTKIIEGKLALNLDIQHTTMFIDPEINKTNCILALKSLYEEKYKECYQKNFTANKKVLDAIASRHMITTDSTYGKRLSDSLRRVGQERQLLIGFRKKE
jgi:hypothetical protein